MIGEEVRRRREELGLTGAQLAERAGLAPSAVSQIETGKRTPSSASVLKLAEGLGVEVGELYPKKAQASLPLEAARRSEDESLGRAEPRYTAFEAFGRALAFGWEEDLKEWNEKMPDGERVDSFDFARLVQWTLEIAGTNAVYQAVARDLPTPMRPELADTMRLLDEADRASMKKVLRAFEPFKTFKEFQKIWEASDMDAVVNEAGQR